MRDLGLLLALEWRAQYGPGRRKHMKDPKERRHSTLLLVAVGLVATVVIGYIAGLCYLLCAVGQAATVPTLLCAVAGILIVVIGSFRTGEALFGARGYDVLCAMPLHARALPLARLGVLYLEDMALTAGVLLPGGVVYAIMTRPGWAFYAVTLVGTVVLPTIPLGISLLLGTLVTGISVRVKQRSMVGSILMIALALMTILGTTVLLPVGLSGSLDELTPERLGEMIAAVVRRLGGIYPPAAWYGVAVTGGGITSWGYFGLLVGVSGAMAGVTAWVVCMVFHPLVRRLRMTFATRDYRLSTATQRSLLRALYVREARRYFASTVYVTNTILGPILGAVLSVVFLAVGADTLRGMLPSRMNPEVLLPVAIGMVFCLMTTTSVSVSMEGKGIELIRSMPIPKRHWLDAKLLWNLTLMLPCWAISTVCLAVALRPTLPEAIWMGLFPLLLMLFSAVLGLTVDLRFHRFDHDSETAVVKQSLSAMLGGFAGPLTALVCSGILMAVPERFAMAAEGGMCFALAVAAMLMHAGHRRGDLAEL